MLSQPLSRKNPTSSAIALAHVALGRCPMRREMQVVRAIRTRFKEEFRLTAEICVQRSTAEDADIFKTCIGDLSRYSCPRVFPLELNTT